MPPWNRPNHPPSAPTAPPATPLCLGRAQVRLSAWLIKSHSEPPRGNRSVRHERPYRNERALFWCSCCSAEPAASPRQRNAACTYNQTQSTAVTARSRASRLNPASMSPFRILLLYIGASSALVYHPSSLLQHRGTHVAAQCVNQMSTPSTRHRLDGVAMSVPHRSTEPARPRYRREMSSTQDRTNCARTCARLPRGPFRARPWRSSSRNTTATG